MSSVVVVCVNYHNEEQTIAFVRRLIELHSQDDCHVVIASNNVSGNGTDALREAFAGISQVIVIACGRNLGYFGAAALALREYRRTHDLSDWVVVSNTDILIETGELVQQLNRYTGTPGIGAIAPSVISTLTGADQNPFMNDRPTAIRMHILKWMFKTGATWKLWSMASCIKQQLRRWSRNGSSTGMSAVPNEGVRPIYAPHGSFIALNREYFRRGGNLDHVPFLYGEELLIAETSRRLQLTVLYEPAIRLRHAEHSTTGKSPAARRYQAASAGYCADTYFPLVKSHVEGDSL